MWVTAGVILAFAVCTAGIKEEFWQKDSQKECQVQEAPVSSVECFEGQIYDTGRLEPKDMTELTEGNKEKQGSDIKNKKNVITEKKLLERQDSGAAWYRVAERGGPRKVRYYETDTEYALGWRLLERDGEKDWYFFDEDTGYMVTDTIVDGALLSPKGYARTAAAENIQTLQTAQGTVHCSEMMLIQDMETAEGLYVKKDMTFLTVSGSFCRIAVSERSKKIPEILRVKEDVKLCIGKGVSVDTRGKCQAAVTVEKDASFDCFGKAGNFSLTESGVGIRGLSGSSRIKIYDGAVITGNASGIVNPGITDMFGGIVTANGTQGEKSDSDMTAFVRQTVSVRRLSPLAAVKGQFIVSGDIITGENAHGICQTGGTLNMNGGKILGNGRPGSGFSEGSLGGGVFLSRHAVMNMKGGVIAANQARYGGGIYVSPGCTLYVTGGRIGGTGKYYESKKNNSEANGNYAMESRVSADKMKYRGGEGGGIYSLGTVILDGKDQIQIMYNSAKGAGGGGGINAAGGKLYLRGKVSVSCNRALSSQAAAASLIYGGGDANGEGGGIRIGQEKGSSAECYINCDSTGKDVPHIGKVMIDQNSASGDGGGIFESSGSSNRIFTGGYIYIQKNECGIGGGGGVKSLGGYLSLRGAVISGNYAREGNHGGGVLTAGKTLIRGCRIFQNISTRSGGGICFYDSSAGTSGHGTVSDTKIYENTAATNGAGIMIGSSKGTVSADGIEVYDNKGEKDGIRCQKGSVFHLKESIIWGNSRYGISNGGTAFISGYSRIGWRPYSSLKQFEKEKNLTGGIFNTGKLHIQKSGGLQVYGGQGTALNNDGGTVNFEKQSHSVFEGSGGKSIVKNTGRITVQKDPAQSEGQVQILGKNTDCGLYNNGGTVLWNGRITGKLKYGIYNANTGNVEIQENGEVDSCKCGVYNTKESCVRLSGGRILGCGSYGIYAESDSQLYMEGRAYADRDSVVFLEPGSLIKVTGLLTVSHRPAAVIDTKKGSDRKAGRVLVHVSVPGKKGSDILGQGAEQIFALAYDTLDTGEKALLRGGEKISRNGNLKITDSDIILSTSYRVSYDSGYRSIYQGKKEDIILEQHDSEKYWMEDFILDLRAPHLVNGNLAAKNWTFRYWEGTDHVIYSESTAVYTKNEDLILKALWKQDYTSYLTGWLYSRSRWVREQMNGDKKDEVYSHFLAGDTGIITFNCRNVENVRIIWPDTGAANELKTYDLSGGQVREQSYNIHSITNDIDKELCFSDYRFRVPMATPEGSYQVQIAGRTRDGEQIVYPLVLYVEDKKITSEIRTRIR